MMISRIATSCQISQGPLAQPGYLEVKLTVGREVANRVARAILAQRPSEFSPMEDYYSDGSAELLWGGIHDAVCWEVSGDAGGYLLLGMHCEREGDDRLDGTLPEPESLSIGQLMDCADRFKRLLALAQVER